MTFSEWFKESGVSEEHRDILEIVWFAALDNACELLMTAEGYTFGVEHLKE